MLNMIEQLLKRINSVAVRISTVLMMGMLAVVTLNVILRYCFGYSITWTEESARFMMVWITFLLFPYAQQRGELVALDFLVLRFRHSFIGVVLALVTEALALLVLSVCVYQSYFYIQRAFSSVSMAMQLPMWIVSIVLPYSFCMTFIASFLWFLKLIPCLGNPDRLKELDEGRKA